MASVGTLDNSSTVCRSLASAVVRLLSFPRQLQLQLSYFVKSQQTPCQAQEIVEFIAQWAIIGTFATLDTYRMRI